MSQQRDESLDLVSIAECEVLEAAKAWAKEAEEFFTIQKHMVPLATLSNLLAAVTLLEERERVRTQIETEKNERLLALMP